MHFTQRESTSTGGGGAFGQEEGGYHCRRGSISTRARRVHFRKECISEGGGLL